MYILQIHNIQVSTHCPQINKTRFLLSEFTLWRQRQMLKHKVPRRTVGAQRVGQGRSEPCSIAGWYTGDSLISLNSLLPVSFEVVFNPQSSFHIFISREGLRAEHVQRCKVQRIRALRKLFLCRYRLALISFK